MKTIQIQVENSDFEVLTKITAVRGMTVEEWICEQIPGGIACDLDEHFSEIIGIDSNKYYERTRGTVHHGAGEAV